MISLDEGLALLLQEAAHLTPQKERVQLLAAAGRVLGEDVLSPVDMPGADYSAMDGYAMASSAFEGSEQPVSLPVRGQCQTGHPSLPVETGTCTRIFTGAHIPQGADTVVMQENVRREADVAFFLKQPRVGENIRRRGEDLRAGETVLNAGTRLQAAHLALLASAERSEVLVTARPRVSILCTGDELRAPGALYDKGQLAESNSVALAALCVQAGAEPLRGALVKDELESMKAAISDAAQRCDLLLTVGGVSVGDHDLVRPVLETLGAHIIFHKLKIKPGKPVLFAKLGNCLILGLPGNPSSAQVVFQLLGMPLLRALAGQKEAQAVSRQALLLADIKQKPGRRGFYRARLSDEGVKLCSNQASGASTSMAWANALVVMHEEQELLEAGQMVPILAYSDF